MSLACFTCTSVAVVISRFMYSRDICEFFLLSQCDQKRYRFNLRICCYYFHVNGSIGIVQKIDFEIRPDLGCSTPKTSRKVVLDNPSVCVSVCLTVCPSCCRFSRELSQASGLTDRVETLGVCSVTWGISPYQFLRRFVNPFTR